MILASLLKTEKIPEIIFQEFLSRQIFYSHFLADDNFYLFLYAKNILILDFLYQNNEVKVLEELDSRTRKIRSVRGFVIYCLEIMQGSKKLKILSTNLQPFFWKKVRRILNQNNKQALEEFLIPKQNSKNSEKNIEIKLHTLEEKIEFLEKRIFTLEDTKEDIMSSAFNDRGGYKITDQDYSTLKTKGEDLKPAFKSLKEISENDKLVDQLALGNRNPGIGTENVFKDVYELRGKKHARVYYREVDGKIEILGKSVKSNQKKVINILKKMYD